VPKLIFAQEPPRGAQRPVLDLGPLLGQSPMPRRDAWRLAADAQRPETLDRILGEIPADAFAMTLLDHRLQAAFSRIPQGKRPELIALVPNVRGLVREATEFGMIGAGLRRLKSVGIGGLLGLGLRRVPTCVSTARGVLKRDFPTMLGVLADLELAGAWRMGVAGAMLHPQMTDLLLAMGGVPTLVEFLQRKALKGRFLGVATRHPDQLIAALKKHGWPEKFSPTRAILAL